MVKKRGPYKRTADSSPKQSANKNFIRAWREHLEMTQPEVADKSGLSIAAISGYERGENDPSLDALARISKATGVTMGMLIEVNPIGDAQLWDSYLRADAKQKSDISKMLAAIVGPPKRKK